MASSTILSTSLRAPLIISGIIYLHRQRKLSQCFGTVDTQRNAQKTTVTVTGFLYGIFCYELSA